LDLGPAADYTALACIEQIKGSVNQYALRYLERFHIGMPYPKMVNELGKIITKLPGCTLVPDATGVGRAVIDLLLDAKMPARIIPVTITAGVKTTVADIMCPRKVSLAPSSWSCKRRGSIFRQACRWPKCWSASFAPSP
jgi:hypothetical protein